MLTQKNKRFLIIWFSILFFALVCNIAPIKGEIQEFDVHRGQPNIDLFTSGYNQKNMFWPFSSEIIDSYWYYSMDYMDRGPNDPYVDKNGYAKKLSSKFNGIFNGFDYLEFLVYGIIGLSIVFIPKVWS